MSVRIMTAVWDIVLPDSQKIVLLALADCANDEGQAWPAIATLARKATKSVRTVQGVIKDLCAAGHLSRREIPGVGCRYQIHPRKDCTPAKDAPPQDLRPSREQQKPPQNLRGTPAAAADNPSMNRKRTLPPKPPTRGRKIRLAIADDWKVPVLADLPDNARASASQWPAGAYAAQAEAFIQYHRGTGQRRADWDALWAAWVAKNHEAVMRQAKAGVKPAAQSASTAPAAPVDHAAAKRHETRRSADLHDVLRERLGGSIWAGIIEPAALLFVDDGLQVVAPTEFRREQIEARHLPAIHDALRAIGAGIEWVKVICEPANKRRARAA